MGPAASHLRSSTFAAMGTIPFQSFFSRLAIFAMSHSMFDYSWDYLPRSSRGPCQTQVGHRTWPHRPRSARPHIVSRGCSGTGTTFAEAVANSCLAGTFHTFRWQPTSPGRARAQGRSDSPVDVSPSSTASFWPPTSETSRWARR